MASSLADTRPAPFLRWPEADAPVTSVGPKAASLAAVRGAGLAVPEWFVVTAETCEQLLAPHRDAIAALAGAATDAAAADRAARAIARLVAAAVWPFELCEAVRRGAARLGGAARFAVRSSMLGEDGARASHAGQLESRLGVALEELPAAIAAVWASAFSGRALLYRRRFGADGFPRVAVIVQRLVASRASGVAFTADPVTGAPALIVEAAAGFGDAVVGGRAEIYRFVRPEGAREWQTTLPATGAVPVLLPKELERLARAVARLQRRIPGPLDLEWTVDERGKLWLLQARPATGLPRGKPAVWDDSNVGESYPGVTLPLTFSFVRSSYEQLFGLALQEAGVSSHQVEAARPHLAHLVGIVRGRLYFNLTHYHALFSLVPGLERTVGPWERALGIVDGKGVEAVAGRRGSRRPLPAIARTLVRFAGRFLGMRAEVRRFRATVPKVLERYEGLKLEGLSSAELFEEYQRLRRELLPPWTALIWNDLFLFLLLEGLSRMSRRVGGKPFDRGLLAGLAGVESFGSAESLEAIVAELKRHPELESLLRSEKLAAAVWTELTKHPDAVQFLELVREHLTRHGYRTIEELKLESTTPTDDPAQMVALLRNHLAYGVDPARRAAERRRERERAEAALRGGMRGRPIAWIITRWLLGEARRAIAARENLSHARSRTYGTLRRILGALGHALTREAALRAREEVFYLTLEELEAWFEGGLPDADLHGIVALRRASYAGFPAGKAASRIVCRGTVYCPHSTRAPELVSTDPSLLRGIPCAGGIARGRARVMLNPRLTDRIEGEILVAEATEPGWLYLMLGARGLIVERGSVLSHAAILGRELGLPTIVGVAGATTLIRDGDELEMDGATGEVRFTATPRE